MGGRNPEGPRILVVMPAYNEERTIGAVIDTVAAALPGAAVLVVDDGSTDSSGAIARAKGAEVVRLPINSGIGVAMQTGYIFAKRNGYDVVVQIDADGQHDPAQAERLIGPILDHGADMTIGSRFMGESTYRSTATRRAGIAWLSLLVRALTGRRFSDPTSGFRAAGRGVIGFFAEEYPTDYPEPEVLLVLHRAGFRMIEVPVVMAERQAGRSSITAIRTLYYLFKVTLAITIGLFRAPASKRKTRDG